MNGIDKDRMKKDLDNEMKDISPDRLKDIIKSSSKQIIETIGESKYFAEDTLIRAEKLGMTIDELVISMACILKSIAIAGSPQRYLSVYCAIKDLEEMIPMIESKDKSKKEVRELYDKFVEIAQEKGIANTLEKMLKEESNKAKRRGRNE